MLDPTTACDEAVQKRPGKKAHDEQLRLWAEARKDEERGSTTSAQTNRIFSRHV